DGLQNGNDLVFGESGFAHGDLLQEHNQYAGRSLNVNGPLYRDAYKLTGVKRDYFDFFIAVRELRLIRAGGRVTEFIARQPATPGFRRHLTPQTHVTSSGASMPLTRHPKASRCCRL
ncbi:hypothetical protein, partial [Klebsiella variicola]|uniref:hypothetical protein n=1 Tax=Klebsiella variicola TaxID=244366 RepID=UPI002B055418